MGAGALRGMAVACKTASDDDLANALMAVAPEDRAKIATALAKAEGKAAPAAAAPAAAAPAKAEEAKATEEEGEAKAKAEAKAEAKAKAKIYGVPISANVLGPVLLAKDIEAGDLEFLDLMKGEHKTEAFTKKNPFTQVPTLEDADGFCLGESNTIMRYLASTSAPALYPADAKLRARVDGALACFGQTVYGKWRAVCYPTFGFGAAPTDMNKARNELKVVLDAFVTAYVGKSGKFICGDTLTLADYKVLPFLYASTQPVMEAQTGVKLSERLKAYVEGLMAEVKSSSLLTSSGGFSVKEYLESKKGKMPDFEGTCMVVGEPAETCIEPASGAAKDGEKAAKIHGLPLSCNCLSPVLMAKASGCGDLEMCDVMAGAHKKPEFAAKNPFCLVPTFEGSDGFCVGESNAMLYYIAANYGKDYLPTDSKAFAKMDWAVENFATCIYPVWMPIVYPVLGFTGPPEDAKAASEALTSALKTFEATFLSSGKFICGEKLTAADFKVLPFFFCLQQKVVQDKAGFTPSERVSKYTDDVKAAIPSDILTSSGGFSLGEVIASKAEAETKA